MSEKNNAKEQPSTTHVNVTNASSNTTSNIKYPWAIFVGLAMGMLVYGVAESYGPVIAVSSIIPSNLAFLAYSLPYIAGGVGAGLAGIIADKWGRKISFIITAALIVIGIGLFLIDPSDVVLIVISFVLVGMAAIGIESPMLSMMTESVPAKLRGSSLTIIQNFGNLGVAIIFIPLILGLSKFQSSTAYALLFIAPLVALVIILFFGKETIPWKASAGKAQQDSESAWKDVGESADVEKVNPSAGLGFRLLFLIVIGIVQNVAFVYITYGVSYSQFPSIASDIGLVGGLMMVLVGIIAGLWIVHRVTRKSFSTFSYTLLPILWAMIWIYVAVTHDYSSNILLALMAIPFIAVETTWASRAMLEPELFATKRRATYISIVRFTVWVVTGIITGYLVYYVPQFNIDMLVPMIVFLAGAAAAWAWRQKGFETGRKSLAGLDVSTPTAKIQAATVPITDNA